MNLKQDCCVLVVDDVLDNLLLLKCILEIDGYQVELATSGSEALSQIRTSPPDLVLLDIMMPEMNGFEVTQQLRQAENLGLMPIVLVTADRETDLERALEAGANDVVLKPIDMDDLLARVGTWLLPILSS